MNNAGGGDSGPIVRKRKLPSIALKVPISELQGKAYVFTLFSDPRACKASMIYTVLMNITVLVSTVVLVVETFFIEQPITLVWFMFDTAFVTFFTFDFVARLLTCPDQKEFWTDMMNWVDVVTTAPYYYQIVTQTFMYNKWTGIARCLRAFRHIRLIRVLKSGPIMINLEQSMRKSLSALVVPIFYMLLSMVVLSALVYFIEMDDSYPYSPEDYGNETLGPDFDPYNRPPFDSLPIAMWWCIVTMTGTGYGDFYPVSWKGQVVAAITAAIGVFFIAMPFAVSGGSFWHAWSVYVEERELEQAMKDGNTTEELSPDELGFQNAREIRLFRKCYKSLLPFLEAADAFEESNVVPADEQVQEMTKEMNSFLDGVVEELRVLHEERVQMLIIREWCRAREVAKHKRLSMPPKPPEISDEEAAKATGGEYGIEQADIGNPVFAGKE